VTILVTGATGNVGRLVVDQLLTLSAKDVRALTTNPKKAALPAEVEVIEAYLGRIETMPAALKGVERMYLAPLPKTVRDVVRLAKAAGVQPIVDLSSSEADVEAAGDPSGWHYYAVEKAVQDSGIAWTHLRPGEFMTNPVLCQRVVFQQYFAIKLPLLRYDGQPIWLLHDPNRTTKPTA
jgi:uncharacterized protein YbjT (DUF2867 family)